MPERNSCKNEISTHDVLKRYRVALQAVGRGPNAWLTGAGARSAEGTDIGHENAEGMAYVGVRVEPTARLGRVGTVVLVHG